MRRRRRLWTMLDVDVVVYLTWYCYNRLLVKAATLSPALGGCSGAGHGGHSWDAGLWPIHWPQWWLGPGAGQTMTGGAPVPNNCHTTTTTNNLTVASNRQRANSLRNHLNNYHFSPISIINEINVKVRSISKPSVCDSFYKSIETNLENRINKKFPINDMLSRWYFSYQNHSSSRHTHSSVPSPAPSGGGGVVVGGPMGRARQEAEPLGRRLSTGQVLTPCLSGGAVIDQLHKLELSAGGGGVLHPSCRMTNSSAVVQSKHKDGLNNTAADSAHLQVKTSILNHLTK